MNPTLLLALYCLLVLGASLAGGLLPLLLRITHRWMEFMVSFVAGVMLGVSLLHLVPHALIELPSTSSIDDVMVAIVAGVLVMFFIERFFCFHHHDAPVTPAGESAHSLQFGEHDHRAHALTWSGAALGLALHSVINGVALSASVTAESGAGFASAPAGLGTFLVVFLHKPFDSMTIAALMAKGNWPLAWRHVVNALFALAVPLGAVLFQMGVTTGDRHEHPALALALAFSAGTFLCIAMSDLLPELQFHQHDRIKLTLALVAGLALAYLVGLAEPVGHEHREQPAHRHHSVVRSETP
jgi:zinc and cadmium transporter